MTSTMMSMTTSGKGKQGKSTKPKTSQKKGPTEWITSPGCPSASKEPVTATETSSSEYPTGTAPLTKQEEVEPIIINSEDEDETASTPESAAMDTKLTDVLGTLTVQEIKKEKTTEEAAGDITQASPSLATQPAVAEATPPQLEMECDDSHTQEADPAAPAVLVVTPQAPDTSTTSHTQPPADDHHADDEEVIDEDALLGNRVRAEGGETSEYELRDEVGPSEDEEDSTMDP